MVETQMITSDKNLMTVNTDIKFTYELLKSINNFQYKHADHDSSDANHALLKSEIEMQRK